MEGERSGEKDLTDMLCGRMGQDLLQLLYSFRHFFISFLDVFPFHTLQVSDCLTLVAVDFCNLNVKRRTESMLPVEGSSPHQ
jgi:hypothetical protein